MAHAAAIIAWTPDEPGRLAVGQVLPDVLAMFGALAIALAAGLLVLRRALRGRADELARRFAAIERPRPAAPPAPVPVAAALDTAPQTSAALENVSAFDLEIAYEPIFDLRGENLLGAEGLMRWKKFDGTPVLEEELSLADVAYLRSRAGILGIRRGLDEIAPLLGLTLTVNISPGQLEDEVFVEKIVAILGATGFQPARLELAVSVAGLQRLEPLIAATKPLREVGVGIAFADFVLSEETIGYAEAGVARRLRLSRTLVSGIDTDKSRFALAEATMGIAKATGLAVTAPGIERREQATQLLRLGCREFEGSLLAAPMPLVGLTALVLAPPSRKLGAL